MNNLSNINKKKVKQINNIVLSCLKNLKIFSWLFNISIIFLILSIIIKVIFEYGILYLPMILSLFFVIYGWFKTLKISIILQEYLQKSSKLVIFSIFIPFLAQLIYIYLFEKKIKTFLYSNLYINDIQKDINYYEEQKLILEQKLKNKKITLKILKQETKKINNLIEDNQIKILERKNKR